MCTYRINWARRTSWGWWDDWDDTVLQTQDSKFEPWRSETEHATSRSRKLPTILTFTRGWGRNIFVSFKPPSPGTEPRTLAWKAAVLTTTLGPPPITFRYKDNFMWTIGLTCLCVPLPHGPMVGRLTYEQQEKNEPTCLHSWHSNLLRHTNHYSDMENVSTQVYICLALISSPADDNSNARRLINTGVPWNWDLYFESLLEVGHFQMAKSSIRTLVLEWGSDVNNWNCFLSYHSIWDDMTMQVLFCYDNMQSRIGSQRN